MRLTRNDDMVLRWGGEEFLIMLRRIDQQSLSLNQFTQRVLDVIGQRNLLNTKGQSNPRSPSVPALSPCPSQI